jgi:hypothetical protein
MLMKKNKVQPAYALVIRNADVKNNHYYIYDHLYNNNNKNDYC